MTRIARAAKTLQAEIEEFLPKAKVEVFGDLDGFGVYRSLRVGDKPSSKRLAPILEFLADRRIEDAHLTDSDYLIVTFKATPVADDKAPFMLRVGEDAMKDAPVEGDTVLRQLPE